MIRHVLTILFGAAQALTVSGEENGVAILTDENFKEMHELYPNQLFTFYSPGE